MNGGEAEHFHLAFSVGSYHDRRISHFFIKQRPAYWRSGRNLPGIHVRFFAGHQLVFHFFIFNIVIHAHRGSNPTLSFGILFMLIRERSASRLPNWRSRALTNSWRCLAMWYSAFSLRSPRATAFLSSLGSSWLNSCSRTLISSCNFFLMCSGMLEKL